MNKVKDYFDIGTKALALCAIVFYAGSTHATIADNTVELKELSAITSELSRISTSTTLSVAEINVNLRVLRERLDRLDR